MTPPGSAATRPEWLPEAHWDEKAGAINTDAFGKHYGELATFHKTETERRAALPKTPDEYKVELKLPDTVKVPEGLNVKVDDKDPRLPALRAIAHQHALPPEAVNALVALDAQAKIEAHNAEQTRVAGEMKALGEKAMDRIAALENWGKALVDKGDITKAEYAELQAIGVNAAGVSLIEKLMAKAAGSVPGVTPEHKPTPEPKSIAERMYPHLPSGLPPASARSA